MKLESSLTKNEQNDVAFLKKQEDGTFPSTCEFGFFNHTPYDLCIEMVRLIPKKARKVLVMFNVELVSVLSLTRSDIMVSFYSTDDIKKKYIKTFWPGVQLLDVMDMCLLECLHEDGEDCMKFDAVLINPPYNISGTQSPDLDFIVMAKRIAKCVIAVHPSMSFISRKGSRCKKFDWFKDQIKGHLKSVKLFNGNVVFNIGRFDPCQIIVLDMTQKFTSFEVEYSFDGPSRVYRISDPSEITKWGIVKEYYSLERKILDSCTVSNLDNVIGSSKNPSVKGRFYINISTQRGHPSNPNMFDDDMFTIVTDDLIVENKITKSQWLAFQSKEEAENCLSYLKSDLARFGLSIFKNRDGICRGELASVPYLPSYEKPWTKARLTKHFNITDAEWAFIEKVIPKYYD